MKRNILITIIIPIVLLTIGISVHATEISTNIINIISNLKVNDISAEFDKPIIEYNGKIFVSEDVIEKDLGYTVKFDENNSTVNLSNEKLSLLYPSIEEITNYLCDDDWNEFKGGCSWYCAGKINRVEASSALQGLTSISYSAKNAHDLDLNTVWSEGEKGYGQGEYLEYTLSGNQKGLAITKLEIINGYVKSDKLWEENSRVKKLKMYKNDIAYAIIMLDDTKKVQVFDIGYISLGQKADTKLKFEILDVYKGTKYDDTVITELEFDGIGDH